jgi:hypothetical protein
MHFFFFYFYFIFDFIRSNYWNCDWLCGGCCVAYYSSGSMCQLLEKQAHADYESRPSSCAFEMNSLYYFRQGCFVIYNLRLRKIWRILFCRLDLLFVKTNFQNSSKPVKRLSMGMLMCSPVVLLRLSHTHAAQHCCR